MPLGRPYDRTSDRGPRRPVGRSAEVFSGTIFWGTVFSGTVFCGTVFCGTVSGGTVFRSEVSLTAVSPDASIAIAGGEERAEAGGRMGGPGDLNRPPPKGCGVRTAGQATDGKAFG